MKQIQINQSTTLESLPVRKSYKAPNFKTPAERYFEEAFLGESSSSDTVKDKILMDKVMKISQNSRESFSTNPFNFYEQYRDRDPLLYELAVTVLSVPLSEDISHKIIKSSTPANVLTVGLNQEMLGRVNFNGINMKA